MRAKLPLMIQDPEAIRRKGIDKLIEFAEFEDEPFFLDGPVTERIAVLDFDDETGTLMKGARFRSPEGRSWGEYEVELPEVGGTFTPGFIQACTLGTVLKTMSLAENPRVLGRRLRWAFDGPQLLVVPRAGEWQNAFYERDTHSLQFFYFNDRKSKQTVFTALSRDIVAHETAHAILDGIVPDLYHALTPQSLAIHEAFADITAVLMAINSRTLASTILEQTHGSIEGTTAFNQIAEQFGSARGRRGGLRDLSKVVHVDDVSGIEPHGLSVVLSSAFYRLLVDTFEKRRADLIAAEGGSFDDPSFSLSGKALALSAGQVARMIYRALDYLPPGEISFIDYGRAIMAADTVAFPGASEFREFLVQAFVDRGIIQQVSDLETDVNFEHPLSEPLDLDDLVESDWVAYQFANAHRDLLQISDSVTSFEVLPRLRTEKQFAEGGATVRDLVFSVSWDHVEDNAVTNVDLPPQRRITAGTSLIINADRSKDADEDEGPRIAALGSSTMHEQSLPPGFTAPSQKYHAGYGRKQTLLVRARLASDLSDRQRDERDAMLLHLAKSGVLAINERAIGPDGRLRATVVQGRSRNNVLKLEGTARMLHITAEG